MRAEELEQLLYVLDGGGNMTAIELTQKEIRKLRYSLKNAESKPNVSEQEIESLRDKIRIKEGILTKLYASEEE